jgi:membrane protease subunit HflK
MKQEFPFDFNKINFPRFPRKTLQWAGIGIFCLILVFSSFFTVNPEEVGIILRFGKYIRTVSPGLNFKLPLGVETVTKVPVERQLKLEFGFRTQEAGVRSSYDRREYQQESLMLTGDLNAAELEWIVQFRIADPYKFLFKVRNAITTFRDMNEALMREVVGDRSVNEVLTVGRVEIAGTVTAKLQELCDQYETGIKVDGDLGKGMNGCDKAAVVLQKSIREGFGLTLAEALWKGTPVIAGIVYLSGTGDTYFEKAQVEEGVRGLESARHRGHLVLCYAAQHCL